MGELVPIYDAMEQLILEIEAHVAARGITPQRFLRDVINAPWGQWRRWKDGLSSPTMRIADKIRAHMAEETYQQSKTPEGAA